MPKPSVENWPRYRRTWISAPDRLFYPDQESVKYFLPQHHEIQRCRVRRTGTASIATSRPIGAHSPEPRSHHFPRRPPPVPKHPLLRHRGRGHQSFVKPTQGGTADNATVKLAPRLRLPTATLPRALPVMPRMGFDNRPSSRIALVAQHLSLAPSITTAARAVSASPSTSSIHRPRSLATMSTQPEHPTLLIPGPIEFDDAVLNSMSHYRYVTLVGPRLKHLG